MPNGNVCGIAAIVKRPFMSPNAYGVNTGKGGKVLGRADPDGGG